jgi:GGDEF domain-containing protein
MPDLDSGYAGVAAAAAAERYVAAAREPFAGPEMIDGPITLSVSVGIALYPDDGRTAAELLVAADAAMYEAKRAGGSAAVAAAALAR